MTKEVLLMHNSLFYLSRGNITLPIPMPTQIHHDTFEYQVMSANRIALDPQITTVLPVYVYSWDLHHQTELCYMHRQQKWIDRTLDLRIREA